jgi:gamma-glutamylcyclotransferase (GGCT)/AIG2-like uncharacterized protein YtfP
MTNSEPSVNLFVYGTLRREERKLIKPDRFDFPEFRRNTFIETRSILDHAPFIGFATTSGILFDVGHYPALIHGEGSVYGEVYQVHPVGLRMIDFLEGFEENNPEKSHYLRKETEVLLKRTKSIKSHAYFYNEEITNLPLITSGDYCLYLKEQKRQNAISK